MELYFLGTNAGVPTLQRNVTSIGLRLLEERRSMWLFDCGEGTQQQILKSPLKLSKLEKLFITHMHGDHIFGLPGLISSRAYQGGVNLLTIYGPPGIKKYIDTSLELSQSRINYPLEIIEHQGGVIFEDEQFRIEAALLEHRIDSYGYRIIEKDKPGRLEPALLQEYGIKPGPLYGQLKKGEPIHLEDGRVVRPEDVLGAPKKGKIVTILGDTRPCEGVAKLSAGADLIVHEATFAHGLADTAHEYYHSTARQAAEAAQLAGVTQLVLTHFSSRYKDMEELEELLAEAKSIFPNTLLAEEHIILPIARAGE